MKLFGLNITRAPKAKSAAPMAMTTALWWPLIKEPFGGAWQRGIRIDHQAVFSHSTTFACMTLIMSDVGKLCLKLTQRDPNGIWLETSNPAYSPVLAKPNHYQTTGQFLEQWVSSKLATGNTYVLKERDNRNVVVGLYVLDPLRTRPKIAPNGEVFYEVQPDYLAGVSQSLIVPASEIIHDRWNCLFHPLCGLSPLFAAGLAAMQGLAMQTHATAFFQNAALPSGILTAPGIIDKETADRIQEEWGREFGGENNGRVAVLGNALKFEPMVMTMQAAQMVEQMKLSAEIVCACFHVPPFMVGVGVLPAAANVETLFQLYYGQCLQTILKAIEDLLDVGLALGNTLAVCFDLDELLRMDFSTKVTAAAEGVKAAVFAPNEARRKFDLPPLQGGESAYMQQQNFSLEALARRDAQADPFTADPATLKAAVTGAIAKLPLPEPALSAKSAIRTFATPFGATEKAA